MPLPAAAAAATGATVVAPAGASASPAGAAITAQTIAPGSTTASPTANICAARIDCTYAPFSGDVPPELQVTFDGTVTSFSLIAGSAGGQVRLRVLRPAIGGGSPG